MEKRGQLARRIHMQMWNKGSFFGCKQRREFSIIGVSIEYLLKMNCKHFLVIYLKGRVKGPGWSLASAKMRGRNSNTWAFICCLSGELAGGWFTSAVVGTELTLDLGRLCVASGRLAHCATMPASHKMNFRKQLPAYTKVTSKWIININVGGKKEKEKNF